MLLEEALLRDLEFAPTTAPVPSPIDTDQYAKQREVGTRRRLLKQQGLHMDYVLPAFKAVSVIFAISAVATGTQAIVNPVGFSRSFGLPLSPTITDVARRLIDTDNAAMSRPTAPLHYHRSLTMSYVSLMGVRQLATGITLLTFAYQNKWRESATVLTIIGIVVAGTDGIYLSRAGSGKLGLFHALPGALIAALAGAFIYSSA